MPSSATSMTLGSEAGNARREAVDEAANAHRPDLAGAEEPGRRGGPDLLCERARIVAGRTEHVRAAAVAGDHQRAGGLAVQVARRAFQGAAQIDVGRGGVAHVQAYGLADAPALATRDRALLFVDRH